MLNIEHAFKHMLDTVYPFNLEVLMQYSYFFTRTNSVQKKELSHKYNIFTLLKSHPINFLIENVSGQFVEGRINLLARIVTIQLIEYGSQAHRGGKGHESIASGIVQVACTTCTPIHNCDMCPCGSHTQKNSYLLSLTHSHMRVRVVYYMYGEKSIHETLSYIYMVCCNIVNPNHSSNNTKLQLLCSVVEDVGTIG